jgi:hypothetical protein
MDALRPDVASLRVADPEKWIGEERRVWTKMPIGRLTIIPGLRGTDIAN